MLFLSSCLILGCSGRIVSLLCSHVKYNSKARYHLSLCQYEVSDQKQTTKEETNKHRMSTSRMKAIEREHRKKKGQTDD